MEILGNILTAVIDQVDNIPELLQSNQFLQGGVVLGIISSIFIYLKNIPIKIYNFFHNLFIRYCVAILYFHKNEATSYHHIDNWLTEYFKDKKQRNYHVKPFYHDAVIDATNGKKYNEGFELFTFQGTYLFRYKWSFGSITKTRTRLDNAGPGSEGIRRGAIHDEDITIRLYFGSKNLVKDFLESVKRAAIGCIQDNNKIKIFTVESKIAEMGELAEWPAPILNDNILETLKLDISDFYDSKEWYVKNGINYTRGYLLYGPPGNGKTSIIKHLATHFGKDILLCSLKNKDILQSISDCGYNFLNSKFIVFEDFDCVLPSREKTNGSLDINSFLSPVSFDDLLNFLDGISVAEDRVIFMTTNKKESFDRALLRPGRLDKHMLIDFPDETSIINLIRKFFPGDDLDAIKNMVSSCLPEKVLSSVDIQELCVRNKDNFTECLSALCDYKSYIKERNKFEEDLDIFRNLTKKDGQLGDSLFSTKKVRKKGLVDGHRSMEAVEFADDGDMVGPVPTRKKY